MRAKLLVTGAVLTAASLLWGCATAPAEPFPPLSAAQAEAAKASAREAVKAAQEAAEAARAAAAEANAASNAGAARADPTRTPPPSGTTATLPMSKEDMRRIFAGYANDRQRVASAMGQRYGQLKGRKREIMLDHAAAMFAMPEFADRVHALIAPKLLASAAPTSGAQSKTMALLSEQAAALGMQLAIQGLTRMGPDEQEQFIRIAIDLHSAVDASTCRAMIDGKLPALRMQQLELDFHAARSDTQFEQTMAMNRRAMLAELKDTPAVPRLTAEQVRAGRSAWGRAIRARVYTPEDVARMERVHTDSAGASDADVCSVTLQLLNALLDLRGDDRVWQLQSYMLQTAALDQ